MSLQDRHNLSAWTLKHQALVTFVLVLVTLFGIMSYSHLSQSEDPPFTFKVMVVRTLWPGATAAQMQEQVTDRIARKLQETPAVDFLRSYSRPGESTLFFTIKDSEPAAKVPDTWYQVRKKVGDIAQNLPQGVQGPFFNDEFGDVYTNIYALSGEGYSPAELHDYADTLRAELLRVPGVAKVDYFGDPDQKIYVEISNTQLAQLGLAPSDIANAINTQNAVASAGVIETPDDRVLIRPSGQLNSMTDLANTLIRVGDRTFRLGDIAKIQRGYTDPPSDAMRFAGHPALGIGITMQPGGDVISLGKALSAKTAELAKRLPAGLSLDTVSSMPDAVAESVDDFVHSVAEAVIIVLIVSLVSLGLRTGMVVVISIPLVLAATALGMYLFDIGLHKVSLGTLVLALGLLVDDAIIAVEMMAVKLDQGWDRARAAAFAYTSTAFPMLTGTLVTVAGFLPIALAKSGTGEYTRSIFEVSAISLLLSWLSAVILIPLLGYHLLKPKVHAGAQPTTPPAEGSQTHDEDDHEHAIYQTRFYTRLKGVIAWCVRRRWIVLIATIVLFVLSLGAFSLVPQQFFPSSNRPELLIDLRLPEGSSYAATLAETKRMENVLKGRPEIDRAVAFVGTGAPRFFLSLDQQLAQPNFAQFVVTAKSVADREHLATALQTVLRRDFGGLRTRLTRLENGPPIGYPVQFRVSGADIQTVRQYAEQVAAIVRADSRSQGVQFDWDEPSRRSIGFDIDQAKARAAGVTSKDIADFLAMTLSSYTVTQYREHDKLISVGLRAPAAERVDPSRIEQLSMPSRSGPIPLGSLGTFRYGVEYAVIWERDRQPTITVQADVRSGAQGIDVTAAIDQKLATLKAQLPVGYRIEVGGAVEENAKAQGSIVVQLPLMLVAVLLLLMVQLQSFSRVLMVVLTAPLGLIGVVAALLLFNQPFGFVAMLGVIAMFGIIMRNSVILVDQIERDIAAGRGRLDAIVGATTRRFRPIVLTATAAVLALIPLLRNTFFSPMATALMGGITIATVLTLFFLPALYAAWFRVRSDESSDPHGGTPTPPGGKSPGQHANTPHTADVHHARDLADKRSGDGDGNANANASAGANAGDSGSGSGVRRIQQAGVLGSTALLLAGCGSLAPDARPPMVAPPAHYAATPLALQTVDAAGTVQHFVLGAPVFPDWWTRYQSPQLDALVAEGIAHSPSLSATQHSVAAAQAQLKALIDNTMLPAVDASVSAARLRAPALPGIATSQGANASGNSAGSGGNALYDNYIGQLRLSYTVDLFGATKLANAASASRVDVEAFQLDAARRTLATQIVVTAIQAAALEEQVRQTIRLQTLADQDAHDAQRREALGSGSHDDTLAAQTQAAAVAASLPGLRQQALASRHALAVLIGRTPDQAPAALPLDTFTLPPSVPVSIPSVLLTQRPDVRGATAVLTAAAAEVGVANAAMYPSLSINAGLGRGGFLQPSALSGAGFLWGMLGSLSMPLFHGGALHQQKRAAIASFNAAQDQYRQTVLEAFKDVADRLSTLEQDAATVTANEQATRFAQARWQQRGMQYQLGSVPQALVRTGERQYVQAVLDTIRARGNHLADTALLFNAMGAGPDR